MNTNNGFKWRRHVSDVRISAAEVLFYGIIISLPFEFLSLKEGLSIPKLIGLIFLPVSLTNWKLFYGRLPKPIIAVLVFAGIGFIVDVCNCYYIDMSVFNEFIRPFFLWLLLLVAYNIALNNRFNRIILVFFVATQILAVYQCLELGGNTKVFEAVIDGEYGERIAALGGDPNSICVFISIGLLYSLVRGVNLVRTNMLFRLVCFISVAVCFYAILKTGSRGGLLAIMCGVISLLFVRRGLLKQIAAGFIIICIVITMGIVVMKDSYIVARFNAEKDRSEFVVGKGTDLENVNTGGRFRIWEASWALICKSPVFGYGAIMHSIELGGILGTKTGTCVTHNIFISVLLTTGISGFICFLYFCAKVFQSVWVYRTMDNGIIIFPWLVIIFVGGMTLNLEASKMFWIVTAMSLALKGMNAKCQLIKDSVWREGPAK